VVRQTQDGRSKGVAMMMVVEKPRIHTGTPQCRLN